MATGSMPVSTPSPYPTAPSWVDFAAACTARLPRGRWRIAGILSHCHRGVFWKRLPSSLGGSWFFCDLKDGIAAEVCFAGQYEPQETTLLRRLLGPGQVFVDVGANWGYFSLLAAPLVGAGGRVVSLEPHPVLFDQLRANLDRNAFTQVTPLRVAACDRTREILLEGFSDDSRNRGISRLVDQARERTRTFPVAGEALDDTIERCGVEAVDCLKMDIEGGEALAVQGMHDLARGRYRRILIELHPVQLRALGFAASDIIAAFVKAGYRGWGIDNSPTLTRRAAVSRQIDAAEFLQPLGGAGGPLTWRHMLWVAPGVELFTH